MQMTRTLILLLLAALGFAGRARADERMNGMVGLYYSSLDWFGFEYDLIAQFRKSKEWMGNISGPFLSEEPTWRGNRAGAGLGMGMRDSEKGTYAVSASAFVENRWDDLTTAHPGAEVKITLMILGLKAGIIDWDRRYVEIGFSY